MIDVLRASLPPDLANFASFQEVLEYDVENSRKECKKVLDQLKSTKLLYGVNVLKGLKGGERAYVHVGNSTYIPSKISGDSVLVSLGYQFYLEMSLEEAAKYYSERIKLITVNLESCIRKVAEKRAQLYIISETLFNL